MAQRTAFWAENSSWRVSALRTKFLTIFNIFVAEIALPFQQPFTTIFANIRCFGYPPATIKAFPLHLVIFCIVQIVVKIIVQNTIQSIVKLILITLFRLILEYWIMIFFIQLVYVFQSVWNINGLTKIKKSSMLEKYKIRYILFEIVYSQLAG